MSKLIEWSRKAWLEAELRAPPVVRHTVMPHLYDTKEIARLLINPYLSFQQWEGQGRGGPLIVNYGGLEYASQFLKHILFEKEPREKSLTRIPIWSLGKKIGSLDGDMTFIVASKHMTCRLPRQGAISLPFRTHHIVKIQRDWDDLWHSFGKSARKQDVRLIRKHGYECKLSRDQKDFETFYHTMYTPTTKQRHGKLASVSSIKKYDQYFQHGFLLLIKRDGKTVSGGLCSTQNKTVNLVATGVVDADYQLTREGAVASIYYFIIRWAHEKGYQGVNLGACWPFMEDGGFQFKRKWGATVVVPSREQKRIWARIQRPTSAVSQFMQNNPCVVVDEGGDLQGLVIADDIDNYSDKEKAGWNKRYSTPGLSDLLVRSITDLMQ